MDYSTSCLAGTTGQRRSRAAQACTTCRKQKVRCEVLDDSSQVLRCHRCRTLNMHCSYEEMGRTALQATHKVAVSQAWEHIIDFGNPHQEEVSNRSAQALDNPRPSGEGAHHKDDSSDGTSGVVASTPLLELDAPPRYRWDAPGNWRPTSIFPVDQGTIDWSSPIQASQELAYRYYNRIIQLPPPPAIVHTAQNTLESIISEAQIQDLLQIFRNAFVPWLNFHPIRGAHNSLLDLVCCTVASRRHLDNAFRTHAIPRLIDAVEENLSRILLHPHPTDALESIQSLLIFAIWGPIHVYEKLDRERDPHIMLSAAISMALNIRLNESIDQLATLKNLQAQNVIVDERQLVDVTAKARLWMCITNIDSMLCIGTNRTPISHRGATYLSVFPRPTCSTTSVTQGRDVRLRLMGETFQAAEDGLATTLGSLAELDTWYTTLDSVLNRLDGTLKYLSPLAVLLDFEQVHFRVHAIMARCCRLIVLYHAIYSARMLSVVAGTNDPFWFKAINPRSIDVLTPWGKDAISICEEVLVSLLELDIAQVATAPDHFFLFIEFVGALSICFKCIVFREFNYEIPGSSNLVLQRVIHKLESAVDLVDHPARRCAGLLNAMLSRWFDKHNALFRARSQVLHFPLPVPPHSTEGTITAGLSDTTVPSISTSFQMASPFPSPLENLLAGWMSNAMSQDIKFWSSLAYPQFSEG